MFAIVGLNSEESSDLDSSVEDDAVTISNCYPRDSESESSSSDTGDTNRQCMSAYILRRSGNITLNDNPLGINIYLYLIVLQMQTQNITIQLYDFITVGKFNVELPYFFQNHQTCHSQTFRDLILSEQNRNVHTIIDSLMLLKHARKNRHKITCFIIQPS